MLTIKATKVLDLRAAREEGDDRPQFDLAIEAAHDLRAKIEAVHPKTKYMHVRIDSDIIKVSCEIEND